MFCRKTCWVEMGDNERVEVNTRDYVSDIISNVAAREVPVLGKTLEVPETGETVRKPLYLWFIYQHYIIHQQLGFWRKLEGCLAK